MPKFKRRTRKKRGGTCDKKAYKKCKDSNARMAKMGITSKVNCDAKISSCDNEEEERNIELEKYQDAAIEKHSKMNRGYKSTTDCGDGPDGNVDCFTIKMVHEDNNLSNEEKWEEIGVSCQKDYNKELARCSISADDDENIELENYQNAAIEKYSRMERRNKNLKQDIMDEFEDDEDLEYSDCCTKSGHRKKGRPSGCKGIFVVHKKCVGNNSTLGGRKRRRRKSRKKKRKSRKKRRKSRRKRKKRRTRRR